MPKPLNKHTLFLRSLVSGWIERNAQIQPYFSVPILLSELGDTLKTTFLNLDLDLSKALSNELVRREDAGTIVCIGVEVVGLGRPPKVYKQKWQG